MTSAAVSALVLAMLSDPPARVGAPMPKVRLVVESTDSACVVEGAVRSAVIARLGRDPFDASSDDVLRVQVHEDARGLGAQIERRDAAGSRGVRTLDLGTTPCRDTLDAIALSIAIAIDPFSIDAGVPSSTPSSSTPLVLEARVAAIVSTGSAPAPSFGAGLGLGVRRARWALAIEGRLDLGGEIDVAPGRVRGAARLGLVVGCYGTRAVACAIGGAGWMRGGGTGFEVDRTDRSPLIVSGLRAGWALELGAIQVVPHVEVLANVIRTRLEIDGVTSWRAPFAQVSGGIAVQLRP